MMQYRFIQRIKKYQLYEWKRSKLLWIGNENLCSKRTNSTDFSFTIHQSILDFPK